MFVACGCVFVPGKGFAPKDDEIEDLITKVLCFDTNGSGESCTRRQPLDQSARDLSRPPASHSQRRRLYSPFSLRRHGVHGKAVWSLLDAQLTPRGQAGGGVARLGFVACSAVALRVQAGSRAVCTRIRG